MKARFHGTPSNQRPLLCCRLQSVSSAISSRSERRTVRLVSELTRQMKNRSFSCGAYVELLTR
jgi:hypothetical protein